MKTWILASATALVAVAGLADAASAADPWTAPSLRGSPTRAPVFPVAHARLNALRQEAIAPAPEPRPAARPAIAGNSGIGQGSNEYGHGAYETGAVISQTAWNHEHQYTGYVFGPGSCDYTPPCVDHLWDGYCQRPHRCHPHHHGHFHRGGCGYAASGCATCGGHASGCDTGCGANHGCHGFRLHAWLHKSCGSCQTSCSSGCNTCGDACGSSCGHGCKLFSGKHLGWFSKLCNACDGGMSYGCSDSIDSLGGHGNQELVPTPQPEGAPAVPDDAKSARRNTINRYLPWSLK